MAFACVICGKKPVAGKSISHSKRATNRRFLPNLQRIRIRLNNRVQRKLVCTTCIKSGRITKV